MTKSAIYGRTTAVVLGALGLILAVWYSVGLNPCNLHPEKCSVCTPLPNPDPPCTINLVLDTSASMRGYFKGQTEFKDTLSRFASALDKFTQEPAKPHCPQTIAFQYYDTGTSNLVQAAANSSEFNDELLNETLPAGKESPLQTMLERVVDASSGAPQSAVKAPRNPTECPVPPANSVLSILVTDSIFSYPDKDVAKNRNVNRDNIEGLAQKVGIIFNKAHAQGKSVSVLALKSQFHGTYYTYQNQKIEWGSSARPYYLWIIGSSPNVHAIQNFLQSEGILPHHALDFEVDSFDPSATILQYTERKGNWTRHNSETPKRIHVKRAFPDDRKKDSDPLSAAKKEVTFTVALDLSHLSQDQLSPEYLANHLKVESQSPDLQVKSILMRTRREIEIDPKDREDIPRATHFVIITTDFKFDKTASVSISIDDSLPPWYVDWSNDDDTKTDQHTLESTFGLRHFVEAIGQAYRQKGPIMKSTILLER